jgi:hypothetical protein
MADMEAMGGLGGVTTISKRGGLVRSVPMIAGRGDMADSLLRRRTDSQVSLPATEVMEQEAMRLQCSDRRVSSGRPHVDEAQRGHMKKAQAAAEAGRALAALGLEANRWKVSLPLKIIEEDELVMGSRGKCHIA